MEYITQQKIDKLRKMYNYFDSKKAIKIIAEMSLEEAQIALNDPQVQEVILSIKDIDALKEIFRKSPAFFQEIMFANERISDLLITPRAKLKIKDLIANYNHQDYVFRDCEIRELEVFLKTIKSPKIYEQLVDNKFFQRLIPLFYEKQIKKTFFNNIDEVQLFKNIVNDPTIFKTRKPRRRNVVEIFNKVSDHILLPDDYQTIISDGQSFIQSKGWKCHDSEKIYIDEHTLSLLSTPMLEELLQYNNIDHELITNYLKKDIVTKIKENNYNFEQIFSHLLTGGYNCFNGIDYYYFKIIIEETVNNLSLQEKFLDFVYCILCGQHNFSQEEEIMIKKNIYHKMKNQEISKGKYRSLFFAPDSLKTVFYLKFDRLSQHMDYLHGISPKQLIYLNMKHLNQILKNLDIPNEDELSNSYSLAIKLYLVFGLERSLKILSGEYGSLNRYFFDNVSKLDVSKIELIKEGNKYLPKISSEFVKFMFASQNDNHFKDMLTDFTGLLNKNWSYLYNHFDEVKEKCHGVLTLKKVNVILKEISPERELNDVSPNNYKLQENDILNDICLGNKTSRKNQEVYKNVLDIYAQMKKRIESSIPYVKGETANGYSYEMMKLNDPIAFTLGYKSNCCIRVNDIAHNHLLHATLCRNGRILLIFDKHHQLAAFVPLKRNGEVLIANSIECVHKIRNNEAITTFEVAIKDIITVSKESETEPINLVCIGREAYAKPKGTPFPNIIKTPTILEKNDEVYKYTDTYHKTLDIIYKEPSLNLSNIKYGNPKNSYTDPRPQIIACDFRTSNDLLVEKSLKNINAVRYENANIDDLENFTLCRRYGINKCLCNEDWYLITTYDGKVYGDYIKYNPQAEVEYQIAFTELLGMSYDNYQKKNGQVKKLTLQRGRY